MYSRKYTISLTKAKHTLTVIVYADRSVEMAIDGRPRHETYQTREEAAWVLGFARAAGYEISRERI
jgi:hypothetical protein